MTKPKAAALKPLPLAVIRGRTLLAVAEEAKLTGAALCWVRKGNERLVQPDGLADWALLSRPCPLRIGQHSQAIRIAKTPRPRFARRVFDRMWLTGEWRMPHIGALPSLRLTHSRLALQGWFGLAGLSFSTV